MKRKLSLVVASLVLSTSCAFGADEKDKTIQMLIERLDKVEAELSKFKTSTDSEIDELHTRADDNELQSALSKVKIGLEFETGVHSFSGDNVDSKNKWTNVLHLNLDAKINDRTTFTGRLGMSKNWGDSTNTIPRDSVAGMSAGGGSLLFVERAYIDYRITDNFIATIGRQPGNDGPGANLRNNSKRQSTYPSMLFNSNGDGLILTYKPKSTDFLSDIALRGGYIKTYQWDNGSEVDALVGESTIDDVDGWLGIAEAKLDLGKMGDNLMIASYVSIQDFSIPAGSVGDITVGDMSFANLYFENNNAFGTSLSWFTSLGYSKGSSAVDNSTHISDTIYKSVYEQSSNALAVTNPAGIASGENAAMAAAAAGGITPSKAKEATEATALNEESGWALHLGLRYDFTRNFKLGYEYFHGSEYWMSLARGSANDPLNKLNTRGDVHDVYSIYQMDLYQFLRLSYTSSQYDYSGSGLPIGGTEAIDKKINHWLLTYNVKL